MIITHLHFDHAAGASLYPVHCFLIQTGTGLLSKHCPNAKVLAHPVPPLSCLSTLMTKRAGPHLVDPSRLINGVKAVYGQERFNLLYGDVIPVEEGSFTSSLPFFSPPFPLRNAFKEFSFLSHSRPNSNHVTRGDIDMGRERIGVSSYTRSRQASFRNS